MNEAYVFKPHSLKQERAIRASKRILALLTGTQWGKTRVGAIRMKQRMHTWTEADDAFLITAPTFKIMSQSTIPAFLRLMDGFGKYNKKEDVFEMARGGIAYFRTETDPDSIIGITNVRHIWGDEAGKYRLYFWENIQARADFCGSGIDLTSSPYALNWVFKEILKPWRKGTRQDVEVIQAASWENPYHSLHDPEKLSAKRATMDIRRFNMIFGGEFGRMEGLVFDCWDDDENLVKPYLLPAGTKYYGGIDWGYYPDPFAMKIRAITPTGQHIGVSEFVKNRLTITDIVQIAKQKKDIYGVQTFYCDPSQPGYIEELNRNGIPAQPADNDIRRGVDLHYELIKTRRYREFHGACPHSMDERETYRYPDEPDLKPDQDSKELPPVDKDNHCMDADRYVTIMTYRRENKLIPKVMGESRAEKTRLDQLKNSWRKRELERYSG